MFFVKVRPWIFEKFETTTKVRPYFWKDIQCENISCQSVCDIAHLSSNLYVCHLVAMWSLVVWWVFLIHDDLETFWGTLRDLEGPWETLRDLRDPEETWGTVWKNLRNLEGTWETVFERTWETLRELERLWGNWRDYMRDLEGTSWNQWVMVLLKK